jgi:hypothetical protein
MLNDALFVITMALLIAFVVAATASIFNGFLRGGGKR